MKPTSTFYHVCSVHIILVLMAALYVTYDTWDELQNDGKCSNLKGSDEEMWRIASTAILLPLLLEAVLDWIVTYYSASSLHQNAEVSQEVSSLRDEDFGHFFVLLSLIPSTYIPLMVFGSHTCIVRDAFVSVGHTVLLYGIIGKLQSINHHIWNNKYSVIIMTFFALAQICMILGISRDDSGRIGYHATLMKVGIVMKSISSVVFLGISRNVPVLCLSTFSTQSTWISYFITKDYLCITMWGSLVYFMLHSGWFGYQVLFSSTHNDVDIWSFRIHVQLIVVVLATVLPGRIIRRALTALERNVAIEKEMNYKKTFVRYVSHEVR